METDIGAALWAACLARVDELTRDADHSHGSSRTAGMSTNRGPHFWDVSCLLELHGADGGSDVYFVTAHWVNGAPKVTEKHFRGEGDDFWPLQLRDRRNAVVIDGIHYRIEPEGNDELGFRGFGGRRFVIRKHNGEEIVTTNLWYQGVIPPKWRAVLPDDAVFVRAHKETP